MVRQRSASAFEPSLCVRTVFVGSGDASMVRYRPSRASPSTSASVSGRPSATATASVARGRSASARRTESTAEPVDPVDAGGASAPTGAITQTR